jgi:mono/diheme cytochrome c family protein
MIAMRFNLVFGLLLLALSCAGQSPAFDLPASLVAGKKIYTAQCRSCHLETGLGIPGVYPPMAGSDFLMTSDKRIVNLVLRGISGPVRVNGIDYDGEMPRFAFSDNEVADVLNYIRHAFGNNGAVITPATVAVLRK